MQKPTFIGQWIKGDTLSDLIVFVRKGDGSGQAFDLTTLATAKLELRSMDGTASHSIIGTPVTDGSVLDPDGVAATSLTQGVLRFVDVTNPWVYASVPRVVELFEAWVTLALPGRFGYLRPSFSVEFRKPVVP